MRLSPQQGGFLDLMGSLGAKKDVTIIRTSSGGEEVRTPAVALIQSKTAYFEITTPIYEGDRVEYADPRGGTETKVVGEVSVLEMPEMENLQHISVKWATASPQQHSSGSTIYNAPVVNISGNQAQVAWGHSVNQKQQTSEVAAGYEALAAAIVAALNAVRTLPLSDDDREIAIEAGEAALREATTISPDAGVVKRSVSTLKGALASLVAAPVSGATAGVHSLIQQLVEGLAAAG